MPKTPLHADDATGRFTKHLFQTLAAIGAFAMLAHPAAAGFAFTAGDLVLSVYGNGDGSGSYADNSASPITLDEVSITAAPAGTIAPIVGMTEPTVAPIPT